MVAVRLASDGLCRRRLERLRERDGAEAEENELGELHTGFCLGAKRV